MKKVLMILGILIVVGAVVALVVAKRDSTQPTVSPTTQTTTPTPEPSPETETTPADETVSETNRVEIQNMAFSPSKIIVKKGTTVTWTNKDSVQHTVTPDDESADFEGSEMLAQGETYSVTFNTTGTFSYHCQPHPDMKATVVVVD